MFNPLGRMQGLVFQRLRTAFLEFRKIVLYVTIYRQVIWSNLKDPKNFGKTSLVPIMKALHQVIEIMWSKLLKRLELSLLDLLYDEPVI